MSLSILAVTVAVELALFLLVTTHAVATPRRLTPNRHWRRAA